MTSYLDFCRSVEDRYAPEAAILPSQRGPEFEEPSFSRSASPSTGSNTTKENPNDLLAKETRASALEPMKENPDALALTSVQFTGTIISSSTDPPSVTFLPNNGTTELMATNVSMLDLVALLKYQAAGKTRVTFSMSEQEDGPIVKDVRGIGEAWTVALKEADRLMNPPHEPPRKTDRLMNPPHKPSWKTFLPWKQPGVYLRY